MYQNYNLFNPLPKQEFFGWAYKCVESNNIYYRNKLINAATFTDMWHKDIPKHRRAVRGGIRNVVAHYDSWLKYNKTAHTKLLKSQFPSPAEHKRIISDINAVYTAFANDIQPVRPNLNLFSDVDSLNAVCRRYTQQVEAYALDAEREVESKIGDYQQSNQNGPPTFIPAYAGMDKDIKYVTLILGDKYDELLNRMVAAPIAIKDAFTELSTMVLDLIQDVLDKWKSQFDAALGILDTKWQQVNQYYFVDKMTDIEEVRRYVLDCTARTNRLIEKLTDYSKYFEWKVSPTRGTANDLEIILHTMEARLDRYFECIQISTEGNMRKLVEFYSTFGHEHRITKRQRSSYSDPKL